MAQFILDTKIRDTYKKMMDTPVAEAEHDLNALAKQYAGDGGEPNRYFVSVGTGFDRVEGGSEDTSIMFVVPKKVDTIMMVDNEDKANIKYEEKVKDLTKLLIAIRSVTNITDEMTTSVIMKDRKSGTIKESLIKVQAKFDIEELK